MGLILVILGAIGTKPKRRAAKQALFALTLCCVSSAILAFGVSVLKIFSTLGIGGGSDTASFYAGLGEALFGTILFLGLGAVLLFVGFIFSVVSMSGESKGPPSLDFLLPLNPEE